MAYATLQDMIDRFGADELIQLTDRTNRPASTIDAGVVAAHLSDAENIADSYLAKRYRLPLDPVPEILTRIVCDIARATLHGRTLEKDDPVAQAKQDAVVWLKDVAKGLVQLEAEGLAPEQPGGGTVQVKGPDRVFSRGSLGGF
jgi:phage gp36-like protein